MLVKTFVGSLATDRVAGRILQIVCFRMWGDSSWPATPGVECHWSAHPLGNVFLGVPLF